MSTANSQSRLESAAASMAVGPAFEDWKRFLTALGEYRDDLKSELVRSPVERMQVTQGHAQALVRLVELLQNAKQTKQK